MFKQFGVELFGYEHSRLASYDKAREESARRKPAYICDMDGTVANMLMRDPYHWATVGEDENNEAVVFAIHKLQLFATIVIVSGRSEACRRQTEAWLSSREIFPHAIFMRPEGDNRSDYLVKKDIYEQAIEPCYSNIMGVFDDSPQVIKLWREKGLFVFDVNNGRR